MNSPYDHDDKNHATMNTTTIAVTQNRTIPAYTFSPLTFTCLRSCSGASAESTW